jgi:hypothetical protein
MSTVTTAVEVDAISKFAILGAVPARRSVAGMINALLKRLRSAAWRILDMGTEFDILV